MEVENPNIIVGKIHSVQVKDFVTYDKVIFYAGEYLNIILGPNGTGKSTIVAAIVLGMGGSPKILSRSSDIQDYIKNGKETAWIQVQIYRNAKKQTITFERQINMNGKSSWKVDGVAVNEKQYIKKIAEYNIQIDNLCQFLPQDRVQDFAKMNPQEILNSTQKSVCEPEMMTIFDELKSLRKQQLNSKNSSANHQQKLKDFQQKYEGLKDAVEKIKERKLLLKQIEMCESKKHWLECEQLQSVLEAVKKDLEQQQKFVQRDRKTWENFKEKGRKIVDDIDKIESSVKKEDGECRKCRTKLEQLHTDSKQLEIEIKLSRTDLETKKKEKNERETRLEQAKGILQVYVQDLKNQQEVCGSEKLQKNKRQDLINELERIRTEKEKLIDKCRDINRTLDDNYLPQLQSVKRKISDLENIPVRRLNMIRDSFRDAHQAVLWLRQNRHIFEGHVYEPMLLELNVRNAENAKYLENSVNLRDLIAFTCTCKNDVDLLTRKLRNEQNLHINVIYSETADECSYQANESINHYKKYGFYSYLINMIEGPAPILNYLCQAYRLHEVMIGNENVDNYSDDLPNHIRSFFGGNFKYSITVSKYSKQKSSLREEIKSRNLFCMSINIDELNQLKKELKDITNKTDILKNQRTQIESQISQLDEKRKEIIQNKKEFEGKLIELQQCKDKLKQQMNKVDRIENGAINIEEEENKNKQFVGNTIRKILSMKNEIIKWLQKYIKHKKNQELFKIKSNIIKKENAELERSISVASEGFRRSQETYETIEAKFKDSKRKYTEKLKISKDLCDGKTPNDPDFPYRRYYSRLPNTVDDIDDKINDLQSRVDIMGAENQSILEEYEKTKEAIQNLTELIENASKNDNEIENRMKELHDKWFPKISEIVENINEHFTKFMSSMNYAGEIQLLFNHERDYDEYGIKIMVQYRNNAKLQALDRFIQSGGERAVAIAVYTLSLQHITNVPFRCVDEINQGMDVINERKIFNMIVQETSHSRNSQYFFITPKFTSGFTYNQTIQVHLVFNGPNVTSCEDFICKK